ncbi:MAG: type II toxin-antitoxin system RelE/ParE family toxin [bacterium]
MSYTVEILRVAQKQLSRLDRQSQERLIVAIRFLAVNPRPEGCLKLTGRPAWRIRVGAYRVIYEIADGQLRVLYTAT